MGIIRQLSDFDHIRGLYEYSDGSICCRNGNVLPGKWIANSRIGMYLGKPSFGDTGWSSDQPIIPAVYSQTQGADSTLGTAVRELTDNAFDEIQRHPEILDSSFWFFKEEKLMNPTDINHIAGCDITPMNGHWVRYTVADTGSGMPIYATKDSEGIPMTAMELAIGYFRSGSNFMKSDSKVALSGTNGVGESASNATSLQYSKYSHLYCNPISESTDWVKDECAKLGISDANPKSKYGWYFKLTYELGKKVNKEIVYIANDEILSKYFFNQKSVEVAQKLPSTVSTMIPDVTVHGTVNVNVPLTTRYLKYLNPGYHFFINGIENMDVPTTYKFNFVKKVDNPNPGAKNPWMNWVVSFDMCPTLDGAVHEYSVNTIPTPTGVHATILEKSWTTAFESIYGATEGNAFRGVNTFVLLQCPEPSFNSQTKEKLSDISGFPCKMHNMELVNQFIDLIKKNKDVWDAHAERIRQFLESKKNWNKLTQLKKEVAMISAAVNSKSAGAFLPRQLNDANGKNRLACEMFICEGKSAAGALIKARDADLHGVLKLKGKPRNVTNEDILESLENDEIHDLVYGIGGVGSAEDADLHISMDKRRYGKIFIASDADVDGWQIKALVCNVFLKHMSWVFGTKENNYKDSIVYICEDPLYIYTMKDGTEKCFYYGEEKEMGEWLTANGKNVVHQVRNKGLGEMTSRDVVKYFFNPATRHVKQLVIDDAMRFKSDLSSTMRRRELMVKEGIVTNDQIHIDFDTIFDEYDRLERVC